MVLAALWRKVFGTSEETAARPEAVAYQGFQIQPQPKRRDGLFITAGIITKTFDDVSKQHTFIRADTHTSFESACAHSVRKAQQIIDEQSEALFDTAR